VRVGAAAGPVAIPAGALQAQLGRISCKR
jgi:hypothetical protein